MNGLKKFFDEERKRVVEPGPFFTQRVMANFNPNATKEAELWEVLPSSTRPVFAVALMLMLCFMFAEVFLPQMPQRGLIESYLEAEDNPTQRFLYTRDDDVPSGSEIFELVIGLGEDQR